VETRSARRLRWSVSRDSNGDDDNGRHQQKSPRRVELLCVYLVKLDCFIVLSCAVTDCCVYVRVSKMPSYGKLKVAELRQLCDIRDVDHDGLTKSQLIEALHHFDSAQSASVDQENDGIDEEDGSDEGDEGIATTAELPHFLHFHHRVVALITRAITVNWEYRYQLEMARLRDRERKKCAEAREARETAREAREAQWEAHEREWDSSHPQVVETLLRIYHA